jgi:serine/threonine protein kinase/tetratricopeptide (TPR) repeat protein
MQKGTLNTPSMPPRNPPADSAGSLGSNLDDRDFGTCTIDIRPRMPGELFGDSSHGSVPSAASGPSPDRNLFVDLHRPKPEDCHRLAETVFAMPEVGTELLGFRLRAELGRGAFGRVYLAEQADLASRAVVLKVTPRTDHEPRTLAQLQHTNIVPVYSVHRAGPIQAVCMPYFGSTTLEHVFREFSSRDSLPLSGKELISTLAARKRTVRDEDSHGAGLRSHESDVRSQESVLAGETGGALSSASPDNGPPTPASGPPAHLEQLQRFSYVEAVLWIGSCLADGLAHAHERGIVHRDLKPANILLTDDGQPMLLDFNLAQDRKLASRSATAQVGGTLPFMAPEQIEAYRTQSLHLDCRSDLYSLGVVIYRMLTGRLPFASPTGTTQEVLEKMMQDRLGPPPRVRPHNRAISPAVESIIRHCLHGDPNRRYQNARQLKEDIDRQLEHRPLRHAPEPSLRERAVKWRRRHPYLASTTTCVMLAGLVIAGLVSLVIIRGQRVAELSARQDLSAFLDGKKSVQYLLTARTDDPTQIEHGVQRGREVLGTYGALQDSDWPNPAHMRHLAAADQERVRSSGAELLVLLARGVALQALNQQDAWVRQKLLAQALRLNEQAEACGSTGHTSRALLQQRAELASLLDRQADAKELRALAQSTPMRTSADQYLVAAELAAKGCFRDALPLLTEVTAEDPQDFWAWFLRGVCHDHLSQPTDAIACYSTCIALGPDSPWAYLNRGLTHLRQQSFKRAAADFDHVIALRPNHAEAFQNRAAARQGMKLNAEAVADLTRALELGASPTHVYFLRAAARERAGDQEGARQDRAEGLRRPPTDEMDWLTRGYARINADPQAALTDFDAALKLNARSLAALQNKAHILSKLGRNDEAARALDLAVEAHPDFVPARAGRGVILARLGKREAAHKDAVDCLARDNKPITLYQLAGIYALTSQKNPDDRAQAFRLLSVALQKGVGFDLLETDRDLDPIRPSPEFQRLVDAARAIRAPALRASTATNRKS